MLSFEGIGVATMILSIRHVTTYKYKRPVAFGEHRMILVPRESRDQKVLDLRLEITPKPAQLRWTQDVFGNHVAVARFAERAAALRVESAVRLDHVPTDFAEADVEACARTYPFAYAGRDMPELAPFIARRCPDADQELAGWVRDFLREGESTDTMALLLLLTRTIRETFTHVNRHEKGVQDPLLTLKLRRGSCRDLAALMIEVVRALGMAARFVSGYLHLPDHDHEDDRDDAGGNMHAWAQIYLPGAGWLDFDPSTGVVGNRDLIRVAVVRVPAQAIPLHGTWSGFPTDFLKMTVAVRVTAEAARRRAAIAV
jgi:transglutaminase-like putative cysteine protease